MRAWHGRVTALVRVREYVSMCVCVSHFFTCLQWNEFSDLLHILLTDSKHCWQLPHHLLATTLGLSQWPNTRLLGSSITIILRSCCLLDVLFIKLTLNSIIMLPKQQWPFTQAQCSHHKHYSLANRISFKGGGVQRGHPASPQMFPQNISS